MKKSLFIFSLSILFLLSGCDELANKIGLKDTQKPIIVGLNTLEITYELGSPMPIWLEGISATDNVDGNLTDAITVDATNVNMDEVGTYSVTYSVSDQSGNTLTEKVIVTIKDLKAPIISGFSDMSLSVNSTEKPDLLNNIIAYDNYDGILTEQITIDDSNVIYTIPGDYIVNYCVKDNSGNSTQVQISLTVLDEEGSRSKPIAFGNSYIISGYDSLYGDYKVMVTVNDIKRGQNTGIIALDEDLNEYLMTNITIKLLEIDETNEYYIENGFANWDVFKVITNKGRLYDRLSSTIIPNNLNDCSLYKGNSCTGNNIYLVDKGYNLYLTYDTTWFNLLNNEITIEIGDTINVVKSNASEIGKYKGGAPIFDESWFSSLDIVRYNIFGSNSSVYTTTSIENINKWINNTLESSNTFHLNAFNGFKEEIKDVNQYDNQFFYVYDAIYKRTRLGLPEYASNISNYQNHLNSDFLNSLEKLNTNRMSYENFFELYGTHLIANGTYVGRIQIFYSVLSNQTEVLKFENCTDISAGITGNSGKSTATTTHTNNFTYFSIFTQGGSGFNITPDEDFSDNVSNFMESINEEENLVLIPRDDGLIPLWDLIPPTYDHLRETMETQYNEYEQHHSN